MAMNTDPKPFSPQLQDKIKTLKERRTPVQLGRISFDSPLLLAPMASICNWPFRLLMEDLGSGGSVSELISCHGINFGNERTLNMLRIDPREKNVGIQIFGEDPKSMAKAAVVAEQYGPGFIDINMGCPVRKVVTKGGGSALLKNPGDLKTYLPPIRDALNVPLTIKIRTGWDEGSINADEVVKVAHDEGVEFVAVHGRTRCQKYTGKANWEYLEELAMNSPLPIIGNGDLHTPHLVKKRMSQTNCHALMLARGPLRNPFIFLEAYDHDDEYEFNASDYLEIIERLYHYVTTAFDKDNIQLVQLRKHIVWFAAGWPNAAAFRAQIFATKDLEGTMDITRDYFFSLVNHYKKINYEETFMTSGHG